MSLTDIARDFPGVMINIKLEDLLKSQEVLINTMEMGAGQDYNTLQSRQSNLL